MSRIARTGRSLSFAFMAFALILSAAAWGRHSVAHGLGQAAAHAGHGDRDLAHGPGGAGHDRQDGGHDHLLGLSFPVAALFDGTALAPPPLPTAAPPAADVATLSPRGRDPPPADPPRLA